MTRVSASVEIVASIQDVYALLASFDRYVDFLAGVVSCREVKPDLLEWTANDGGRTFSWRARITSRIANEALAWESIEPPRRATTIRLLAIGAGVTRVDIERVDADEIAADAAGDATAWFKRRLQGDLARLRSLAEAVRVDVPEPPRVGRGGGAFGFGFGSRGTFGVRPGAGAMPPASYAPAARPGAAAVPAAIDVPPAPPAPPAPAAPGRPRVEPAALPSRYAAIALFETDGTIDANPTRELQPDEALTRETWYALKVWVDTRAEGLPVEGGPQPIVEPGAPDTIRLLVLAWGPQVEVRSAVTRLELPPQGRSLGEAVFTLRAVPTAPAEIVVRVQIMYRLNLVEDLQLTARLADPARPARAPGALVVRRGPLQEFSSVHALPAKGMHIHVSRSGEQYAFYFVLEVPPERVLFNGKAPARLGPAALDSQLTEARQALLRIALDHAGDAAAAPPFASATEGPAAQGMAKAGRRLWNALFKETDDDAMREIAGWLTERHLEDEALIQVTVDDNAGDFVFPWNLLYDRPVATGAFDAVETGAFWGLRYVIEQHLPPVAVNRDVPAAPGPGADTIGREASPLRVAAFMGNFGPQRRAQEAYLAALAEPGGVAMKPPQPVVDPKDATAVLGRPDADLLYFFTHGHTRKPRTGFQSGVTEADFMALFDTIASDARRAAWQGTYDRIKAESTMADETWIELVKGRVTIDDLYEVSDDDYDGKPVVFLNMCESVQISPMMTGGFVDYFMNRGATALVGTETSVPPPFGHAFGLAVLAAFLGGTPLGLSLLRARRDYATASDLFGLAYSLYGSARVRVAHPVAADAIARAVDAATAANA